MLRCLLVPQRVGVGGSVRARWRSVRPAGSPNTGTPDDVTVGSETQSEEYVVKNSIFVGHCAPCEDEKEAKKYAQAIKLSKGYSHACWAYRGYRFWEKASDDGEPRGTAGEPILQAMQKRHLRKAVVVVTREYGGVKLGTGGLFSAYGKAAELAIDSADFSSLPPEPGQ